MKYLPLAVINVMKTYDSYRSKVLALQREGLRQAVEMALDRAKLAHGVPIPPIGSQRITCIGA